MNKQELIEKYQQIYEVSNNTDFGLDPFSRGEDAGSSRFIELVPVEKV